VVEVYAILFLEDEGEFLPQFVAAVVVSFQQYC
jgi:hypothetical protein